MCVFAVPGIVAFALQEFAYLAVVSPQGAYEHHLILELNVWLLIFVQTFGIIIYSYFKDVRWGEGEGILKAAAGGSESLSNNNNNNNSDQQSQRKSKYEKRVTVAGTPSAAQPQGPLSLSQVLRDPDLYNQFEEHLAMELAVESLVFLRDAKAWREDFSGMNDSTRLTRAKRLIRLYVRSGARYQINIPSAQSKALTKRVLEGEGGALQRDLFDASINEVTGLLERGSLRRFNEKLKAKRQAERAAKRGKGARRAVASRLSKTASKGVKSSVIASTKEEEEGEQEERA